SLFLFFSVCSFMFFLFFFFFFFFFFLLSRRQRQMCIRDRKGDGWQVELGLREGERRGRWWPSRYGTAVKGDAAQDSAVFFNT
ncbi:hypothetical protein, partial [Klebsiella pneumoniae]|uniref:hypothetical protein n=1 Tax=Klebsiella pneumoniae TaxID=573 RepID=UPI001C5586C4